MCVVLSLALAEPESEPEAYRGRGRRLGKSVGHYPYGYGPYGYGPGPYGGAYHHPAPLIAHPKPVVLGCALLAYQRAS